MFDNWHPKLPILVFQKAHLLNTVLHRLDYCGLDMLFEINL